MGPKLMNCCKPEQMGTKERGNIIQNSRRRQCASQGCKRLEDRRIKEKITRKEYERLVNKFEMERFNGSNRLVEVGRGENHDGKRRGDQCRR